MSNYHSCSKKLVIGLFLVVFCSGFIKAELPPLIPRQVLFGDPEKSGLRISPDGKFLSYLAPLKEGVLNIWVKTIDRNDDRMVTRDTRQGIYLYRWAYDSKHILYLQEKDGDENWHIYSAGIENDMVRDLTPFQGVQADSFLLDMRFPEEMLVSLNIRNKELFDMYRVNLRNGAMELDTENQGGMFEWVADSNFVIRAAISMNPNDGSFVIQVRDDKNKPWRKLMVTPFEENVGEYGAFIGFTPEGKAAYCRTSVGFDTGRLVKMDLETGKILETIAFDEKCDLNSVLIHPEKRHIQAASFNYLVPRWQVLDASIKEDFNILQKAHRGAIFIADRDLADQKWIVLYSADDGPMTYHLYDRAKKDLKFIFENRPVLNKFTLARIKPIIIKARDGLELVSYLTLPVGIKPQKLPMVILVHGGPWGRDSWGFNPPAQWLANRGYAVLQVNFRGSQGFGKKYLNAGNLQWGVGSMQHDLTDAVKWAIGKGYADPKKIAIMGISYGGYATLAGLAFTPELYACGVDINGPANLKTLLQKAPPSWKTLIPLFIKKCGDVLADDELNKRISPFFHVKNIKAPLLVTQGKNDPRAMEADELVKAMREKNLPVKYIVYTNDGHSFSHSENYLDFWGHVDEFLGQYLGGRVEPYKKIEGSSGEIR